MGGKHRPNLSSSSAKALVQNSYGMSVTVVQELTSYDDQNFLVEEIPDSSVHSNGKLTSSRRFVLKILNALDSQKPQVTETQTEIILHAKRAGIPTPGLVPTTDGRSQLLLSPPKTSSEDGETRHFVVRLFAFIPDQTLDQVTLTRKMCYEVGWLAGKLDYVLLDFSTADNSVFASMTRDWNMSHIPKLKGKLHAVRCPQQQRIIEDIIDNFEMKVVSAEHKFSKGLIHGDFNECNILVSQDCKSVPTKAETELTAVTASVENSNVSTIEQNLFLYQMQTSVAEKLKCTPVTSNSAHSPDANPRHVSGIIDFGDTTLSLYVYEVAIAIVYIMMNKHGVPAMEAASLVLSGYLQHIKLTRFEISHLKLCVCARLAQSLVLGCFSITSQPDNEYILTHTERVWPVLKYLWDMPDEVACIQFREHVDNNS